MSAMKPTLSVYALPRLVEPEELAGGTAVVIDVLRAATTIAYALDGRRRPNHSVPRNLRSPGFGRAVSRR